MKRAVLKWMYRNVVDQPMSGRMLAAFLIPWAVLFVGCAVVLGLAIGG